MERPAEAGSADLDRNVSLRHWEPPARDRVRDHSSPAVNRRIDRRTVESLEQTAGSSIVAIGRRLRELDREWDIDRALMANFAILGGLSAFNAIRYARDQRVNGWTALLTAQLGFLLYHASRGWCPPVAVFRRLGFRTRKEIEAERRALEEMLDERIAAAG